MGPGGRILVVSSSSLVILLKMVLLKVNLGSRMSWLNVQGERCEDSRK